jgi:uncharacterized protein
MTAAQEPGVGPLRRAARLPFVLLIRAYQLFISPWTASSCRYYPSCSQYALIAIERHGVVRGGWLALRRLGRCHPWTPGGVDHVPPRRDAVQHTPSTHALGA